MQENQAVRPCRIRHYVLATPDKDVLCNQLYDFLELKPTQNRDGPGPTEAFGFTTEGLKFAMDMDFAGQRLMQFDYKLDLGSPRKLGNSGSYECRC